MSSPSRLSTPARDAPRAWLDRAAVAASALCLVHCLLLPLLLAALPALAAVVTLPEQLHVIAFAVAVPTSTAAMGLGWRRHARTAPALVAAVALALLGTGALAVDSLGGDASLERWLTSLGGVLLAGAHLANARAVARCGCPTAPCCRTGAGRRPQA